MADFLKKLEAKEHTREDFKDVFKFEEGEEGWILTKYIAHRPEITIPGRLEGKPVVEIGRDAFSWNDEIESVIIESGVKVIARDAFYHSALEKIAIPNSVKIIGETAFGYCDNKITITFDGSKKDWWDIEKFEHFGYADEDIYDYDEEFNDEEFNDEEFDDEEFDDEEFDDDFSPSRQDDIINKSWYAYSEGFKVICKDGKLKEGM